MLRRLGAAVAVLALLYGFGAAPYTHAHHAIDSVSDARHPHGATLVHTHASSHAHPDADRSGSEPAGSEEGDEQMWSVDRFAFQRTVPTDAPSPALHAFGEPHVQPTSIPMSSERLQPKAHGPPVGTPSGLRAPPVFLPAFA
jgi:hypothetical protein